MRHDCRTQRIALGAALIAGLIAATITYLLHMRPQWRRHVSAVGRHLLGIAEGMGRRGE